jgi:hypothetical protein
MNHALGRLISDYQKSVRVAVELMKLSGISLPTTSIDWAANGISKRGELDGGIPYFKHGYGCEVKLPSGAIDFDFGEHGETHGFDAWRLIDFAGSRLPQYGFSKEASLLECFKSEVVAGNLVKSRHLHYIAGAV